MRPDLEGLAITPGELKHWSGVRKSHLYRPPTLRKFLMEGFKTCMISSLILISYLIWILIFPESAIFLIMIHSFFVCGIVLEDGYKIINTLIHRNFIKIFDQVDRYNDLVQGLIIHDQIEEVGNLIMTLDKREQAIAALKLIRADLIRALKTAKLLNKNKRFVTEHSELFDSNLSQMTQLQTSEPTSEEGRFLQEALKIASEIQEELHRLQVEKLSLSRRVAKLKPKRKSYKD